MAVTLRAAGEPAFELVGGASPRSHETVDSFFVDSPFFAFANDGRPRRRAHLDLAVEHAYAIGAARITVDGVDSLIGRRVARARRVEAERLALIIGALNGDVAVAQLDDCFV